MKSALSRYQIRRELGRGGTGVVYEAFDSDARSVVALKTIESAMAEQLYRLKHEFRALADVQHPNLVRFGELACGDDGRWFFTMELVDGTDFVQYVRGPEREGERAGVPDSTEISQTTRTLALSHLAGLASGGEPSSGVVAQPRGTPASRVREHRLRAVLPQLVAALGAIHAAGHVHRDVKPSNVLVTKEGRVVVLDFGLVAAATADVGSPVDPWLVGTPAYMAPEQIAGGAVGPPADWYALGVMLFVALTGALPFDGDSPDVLRTKVAREAPSPLDIVPGLPPDLCELAADLLRTDPAARPNEEAIRARVGGPAPDSSSTQRAAMPAAVPFVGRAAELRLLGRVLDGVNEAGVARRAVVEGEPGIGKSSLVRRFLRGHAGSALLLSGRCYEQEDVPFKGIDGIVDALSEHLLALPDDEVLALVAGGVRYLTTLFPVLSRVPTIEDASTRARAVGNPAAIREQGFQELEALVDAIARTSTVILHVDDLQWADKDSVALFERLVRRDKRTPLLFVATLRTGAELAPEVAAFVAQAERVALRGLSPEESRALLEALWGTREARGSASKDGLVREAEGHPLFLAELVRSMDEGTAARGGGVELQGVLWERIQARDAVDRRFLEMVAVAGAPVPYAVIAAAAEVDVGEAQTRLGSLRAAQLVRVARRGGERTVEPYHDRVRESIQRNLRAADPGGRVATMHHKLARALVAATPGAPGDAVFPIVAHFNAAREVVLDRAERLEVARLDLLAAREALRATAYDRARGYARAGLAFLGDDGWRDAYEDARDLHVEHMWAAAFADDAEASPEAEAAFHAARARVRPGADETALHIEWIDILTMRRQLAAAIAAGRDRLAHLGVEMPLAATPDDLRAQREAIRRLQAGRSAEELLKLPAIASQVHEAAIRTLVALVPAAFFVDASLRAWMHMRVVLLTVEHGLCGAASYSLSGYGTLLRALFREHAEGAAFGRAALALHERFPDDKSAARLLFHYGGWHAPWVGPLALAQGMLRRGYALAREHGDTTHETYAATVLSVVTFCASDSLAAVQETADWAADVGYRRRDFDMAGVPDAHARYAAALRGETGSARDLGRAGSSDEDFRARLGPKTPTALFYYLFCNAELAYLAGDAARADALLREAVRGSQVIAGLPTVVELALLECLVAARLHEAASPEEQRRLAETIALRVEQLREWAETCAANFEPQYLLARAELARAGGGEDPTEAYERAWTVARARGASKREALALARGAALARARGEGERASMLDRAAAEAFGRWGAMSVTAALPCG